MTPALADTLRAVAAAVLSHAPHLAGPFVTTLWLRAVIILAGYAVTLMLSGPLVHYFIRPKGAEPSSQAPQAGRFDSGAVIGKCENILALTFILSKEVTALSLLFGAKSLVRTEEIRRNPGYFLVGFLVNFVWSVVMGFLLRMIVIGV